jgi:hypothetical protein
MVDTNFTPPLTILQRARLLAHLSDTLHAEAIELTMSPNAMHELAQATARHANILLELIESTKRRVVAYNTFAESMIDEELRRHP